MTWCKHNLWYQEVKRIALWVMNPHHWLDSDWAWLGGRAIGDEGPLTKGTLCSVQDQRNQKTQSIIKDKSVF